MTLSNNTSLARALKILHWVTVGVAFLSCLGFIYMMSIRIDLFEIYFLDSSDSLDSFHTAGTFWAVCVYLTIALLGLQLLVFMAWIYRSYRNLIRLGSNMDYWLGWAILGILIPFANYILPILLLQDLLKKSHDVLNFFDEETGLSRMEKIRNWTVVWWGLYVVSLLTINIMSSRLGEDDVELAMYLVFFLTVGSLASIILGNFLLRHHFSCEQRIYALWKSGQIKDSKSGNAMQKSGVPSGE